MNSSRRILCVATTYRGKIKNLNSEKRVQMWVGGNGARKGDNQEQTRTQTLTAQKRAAANRTFHAAFGVTAGIIQ